MSVSAALSGSVGYLRRFSRIYMLGKHVSLVVKTKDTASDSETT